MNCFSMFIVCMLPADPRKRTTRGSYVGMCKGCLVDRGILTLFTGGGGSPNADIADGGRGGAQKSTKLG